MSATSLSPAQERASSNALAWLGLRSALLLKELPTSIRPCHSSDEQLDRDIAKYQARLTGKKGE